MSRIRVKNFGPIKEGFTEGDGWIDIKKVTLFIGNQGSGKSTVAKLISTFSWMEKALNRGDGRIKTGNDIRKQLEWQRLGSYFNGQEFELAYQGERYNINYSHNTQYPIIEEKKPVHYKAPKIMYVPAERNFLSTIKGAFDVTGLPGPLATFAEELRRAQQELDDERVILPIGKLKYHYDTYKDISFIIGEDFKLDLLEASSGLHSLIPLYIVSNILSDTIVRESDPANARINANQSVRRDKEISTIMLDKTLSIAEKDKRVEQVFAKYHNECFINIVEEPEQNLFPTSQKEILYSLLEFNNRSGGNKLIVTTHSPYLINHLTLAIEAKNVLKKIEASSDEELKQKVFDIVPEHSMVGEDEFAIYEMDEASGTITLLKSDEGIPSGKNYLNQQIKVGNDLFDKLLEIDQTLS